MASDNMAAVKRSQVHTEVHSPIESVIAGVVWFVFGVIEVFIGIRFVLKLIGANAEAGFVQFVNGFSGIFMAPFDAILGTDSVSGATLEWSALVAIVIYALIAWGLVTLIGVVSPRRNAQTIERVEEAEKNVVQE